MKELVEWLIRIERLAGDFYNAAARAFKDDKDFAGFLKHLAEDEASHCRVLERAAEYLEENKGMEIAAAVALDSITREKVEAPFLDCGKKLKSNTMTREHLINCIAAAEFSEWNNIFVYIVNTLKDARPEFAKAAAGIQAHKHHIENMIASLPEGRMYLETLRRLPPVWTERILLVENHAGVMEFLNAVLSTEVAVETAMNGEEGLDKVRKTFFDVVISDVDLPVMNGIEFYKSASLHDPHIGDRFLFLTGSPTDETLAFFEQRGARFLAKPIHINEFRETVSKLRDKRPIKT